MVYTIAIIDDQFLNHLFHQLELMICMFSSILKDNKTIPSETQIVIIGNEGCLSKISKVHFLFLNIFNCSSVRQSLTIPPDTNLTIDRNKMNSKGINKIAEFITDFNDVEWRNRVTPIKSIPHKKLKILYSIRENEKVRNFDIKSEIKLRNVLKPYNPTIINAGKFSLQEQIDIFSQHNVLIGIHGNNLSGIMWMPPESLVIEFQPFTAAQIYDYQCMSKCMKAEYILLQAVAQDYTSRLMTLDERVLLNLEKQLHLRKALL